MRKTTPRSVHNVAANSYNTPFYIMARRIVKRRRYVIRRPHVQPDCGGDTFDKRRPTFSRIVSNSDTSNNLLKLY